MYCTVMQTSESEIAWTKCKKKVRQFRRNVREEIPLVWIPKRKNTDGRQKTPEALFSSVNLIPLLCIGLPGALQTSTENMVRVLIISAQVTFRCSFIISAIYAFVSKQKHDPAIFPMAQGDLKPNEIPVELLFFCCVSMNPTLSCTLLLYVDSWYLYFMSLRTMPYFFCTLVLALLIQADQSPSH